MRKMGLKSIGICAVILYVIALIAFHLDYEYINYMCEEYEIIIPVTLIYFIVIALVMFFMYNKKASTKEEQPKVSIDNFVRSINKIDATSRDVKSNKLEGTGIVGLTRYATFCQIIGILGLFIGVLLVLISIKEGQAILLYGICFIIGGTCCLLSILFVNALVTITKAAKTYIDNNQNK